LGVNSKVLPCRIRERWGETLATAAPRLKRDPKESAQPIPKAEPWSSLYWRISGSALASSVNLAKLCRLAALRWPERTLFFNDGESVPAG
jgi:hypothetical protein